MAFANLDDAVTKIRSALKGSASLDLDVMNFLNRVDALSPTQVLADLVSLIPNGKAFVRRIGAPIVLESLQYEFDGSDFIVAIGTPPEFGDHSHGKHPRSLHLAALIALLKFMAGRP
jgi:hypothetical protein